MTKIYELAEQAAEYAVLNYSEEVLQSETDDVKIQIPKEFIDKFAELLIKECAKFTNYPEELYKHYGDL